MALPTITEDQWAAAVALLAAAIRADERLEAGRYGATPRQAVPLAVAAGRQREGARRYAQGVRDALATLFADGAAVAEECARAARAEVLDSWARVW